MDNKIKQRIKIFSSVITVLVVSLYLGFNLTNQEANAESVAEEIMVYKSPTCGCCEKWVKHLENEGFNVKTKNMRDLNPIKNRYGVQQQYQSCHTAKIGEYFVEGHVPAEDIKRLLKEKPDIKGLTVPGMVMGSPGMEGPRKDPYNVLAIDKANNATVYSKH